MKRVKIMLMSLTLLAIVGGALAFKAKFNLQEYCTSTTVEGIGDTCPVFDLLKPTNVTPVITVYYTTPDLDRKPCFIGLNDDQPIACDGSSTFTDVEAP
jgi:hypothetical protein